MDEDASVEQAIQRVSRLIADLAIAKTLTKDAARESILEAELEKAVQDLREVGDGPAPVRRTERRLPTRDLNGPVIAEQWLQDYERTRSFRSARTTQGQAAPSSHELGLLDQHGEPLNKDSDTRLQLATDIRHVSRSLKTALGRRPELLFKLTPRQFEEVVAELLSDRGYDVELGPLGPDGGVDIYAAKQDGLGSFLYLVQCKRFSATRPVSLDVVQRLHGRVAADRATAGVVVTASRFTQPAKDFAEQIKYQMTLREFAHLQAWLEGWRG
jgi:restriction endonuclease Mrr